MHSVNGWLEQFVESVSIFRFRSTSGTRGSFFENSPSTTIAAALTPVWDQGFRNHPTRAFRLEFTGTCCPLVTTLNRCQFLVDYITNIAWRRRPLESPDQFYCGPQVAHQQILVERASCPQCPRDCNYGAKADHASEGNQHSGEIIPLQGAIALLADSRRGAATTCIPRRGIDSSALRGNGGFPSGHTIAAFSVASVIGRRYEITVILRTLWCAGVLGRLLMGLHRIHCRPGGSLNF